MNDKNVVFRSASNNNLEVMAISALGDRSEQQDSFDFLVENKRMIASVCDGMGGHTSGSVASKKAVETFLNCYRSDVDKNPPSRLLLQALQSADNCVSKIEKGDKSKNNAGTTTVTVIIDCNNLYWASVGDSRLYIYRKKELLQITKDQNYNSILTELLQHGEITYDYYLQESNRGEELISYLGIGTDLPVDYNEEPLSLKKDDCVVLMTDGLYRVLNDRQIKEVLDQSKGIKETAFLFESQAEMAANVLKKRRDNTTVIIIKIKEEI